jgi:hypothetical protein
VTSSPHCSGPRHLGQQKLELWHHSQKIFLERGAAPMQVSKARRRASGTLLLLEHRNRLSCERPDGDFGFPIFKPMKWGTDATCMHSAAPLVKIVMVGVVTKRGQSDRRRFLGMWLARGEFCGAFSLRKRAPTAPHCLIFPRCCKKRVVRF